jgi:hypothetical protein
MGMGQYAEATWALNTLLREVAEREGMDEEELTAARRTREVVGVTKLFVSWR